MAFSYHNYTGDNTTTQFSIPFTYQAESEISVTVDGVAETGLTFPSSSTVELTSAPATGTLVQVRRTTSLAARAVDFASGSVLTEEDLDDSNIQVFHAAQEAIDTSNDSITLTPANRWDAGNSIISNVGTPVSNTDAATKAYADGISSAAATAAVTAANAAVTAATGAIVPDATKLAIHPIGTQYTLSDGTTTDYSAKHYANEAATEATAAAADVVLTNADVVTTAAAVTAAENARDATLAAYDNFDDRYLGVFTTALEPVVDNDGNALVAGSLYFNSTDGAMQVYTGSAWVAAYVSGVGFLASASNLSDVADAPTALTNLGLTATAAELNTLSGITSDVTELNYNDITTLGLVEASKTVTADANAEITIPDDKKLYFGTDQDAHIRYDENTTDTLIVDGAKVKFGQAVRGNTFSSNITGSTTLSFANYQNFIVTLTGNVTLSNPTTETTGQTGFIVFIQDSTGGYTVSLGTDYETAGGAGLTLSTTADAYDVVPYIVKANGSILLGTPQLAFA